MYRTFLKSKIHRATITDASLNYEGSITIDRALCNVAGLSEYEQVDVYNCSNGERFTTYVILGENGEICVNGAAARLVAIGDQIIIACYAHYNADDLRDYQAKKIFVDDKNRIKNT